MQFGDHSRLHLPASASGCVAPGEGRPGAAQLAGLLHHPTGSVGQGSGCLPSPRGWSSLSGVKAPRSVAKATCLPISFSLGQQEVVRTAAPWSHWGYRPLLSCSPPSLGYMQPFSTCSTERAVPFPGSRTLKTQTGDRAIQSQSYLQCSHRKGGWARYPPPHPCGSKLFPVAFPMAPCCPSCRPPVGSLRPAWPEHRDVGCAGGRCPQAAFKLCLLEAGG